MQPFQYLTPQRLDEALALLTPKAVPLAGGTDLFLRMERRQTRPEAIVDLKRIPGMDGIEPSGRVLRIGALALMETLSASFLIRDGYPALGEAARVVGSTQTRNRATIGGNLANASPAADTATPLMALSAVVEATGADGTRELAVDELFRGPGKTALRDGELLTAILVPPVPALAGSAFQRCVRTAMDIAVVNCAAFVRLDENGIVVDARIALGAVGPTPLRAASAESSLKGHGFSARTAEEAAECAAADARPIDDVRAGADYRREMVRVLTRRAIESAFQRARGDA